MKFLSSLRVAAFVVLAALGASVATAQTISANASSALSLAEELYPDIFKDGGQLMSIQGYVARYYAASKVYVGFKDGNVYLVGGPFGDKIVSKGPEATVVTQLNNIKLQVGQNGNGGTNVGGQIDVGGAGGSGDLYDLTISGKTTATVAGFPFSVNLDNLVLKNVAGMRAGETKEIEDSITEYFKDVGTIANLKVVSINDTKDRITFDLSFSATIVQQGISTQMTYDLRYDFVRVK